MQKLGLMNSGKSIFYSVVFFFFIFAASHSIAQESVPPATMLPIHPGVNPSPPPDQMKTIPAEEVSAGIFRIGDIQINKENRSIIFPALVNMDKGLLEYLLVHSAGKTHESLFRTKVQPYNLQLAFMLLGFKGTDRPLPYQGAPEKPKGEPLEITVTYDKKENQTTTIRPEEWIVKTEANKQKDIGALNWVFTGSMVIERDFLAQREGSIIAIFHDPVAIIDNSSTGGESDKIWFVKEGVVPPVGTPVTVTIKAIR
jgi:hypothetical protein